MIKLEISSKNQNIEKHIYHHCELDSFPKLKGFSNEIGDTNEHNLYI